MLRVQYFLKLRYWLWSYSSVQHILPKMTETFEYVLLPKSFSSGTVLRIENFQFSFESCCTAASLFSLQSNPSVRHLKSIVLPWKEANCWTKRNFWMENVRYQYSVNQEWLLFSFLALVACICIWLCFWKDGCGAILTDVFLSLTFMFLICISPFSFEKDDRGAVEGGNLD